jgi:two-component system LytT family response regulator
MRIAAVDDETHALERFERMVSEIEGLELCGLFDSGEKLLAYLTENPLDVVFLDIEIPGISGIQLSEQIQNLNEQIDIVFVTAFNQYAVEAFEVQAVDYILKPLTEERLGKTVSRLLKTRKTVNTKGNLFVQCFGDFEVFVNGEALTWKNSKAKEVLAFLVHKNGVPVGWEKIADAVWPDFNAEKAQTNFHATTYLLRKRLAEVGLSHIIESVRGNYRVVTDKFDCDVYKLEEMIHKGQMNRKEDFRLLEQLMQKGYMEGSGYAWAYPKAAELEALCRSDKLKK